MDELPAVTEQPETIQTVRKYNKLVISSLVLALIEIPLFIIFFHPFTSWNWISAISPIIYYVTIILASVALGQIITKKQKGLWMTVLVLVVGSLPWIIVVLKVAGIYI